MARVGPCLLGGGVVNDRAVNSVVLAALGGLGCGTARMSMVSGA